MSEALSVKVRNTHEMSPMPLKSLDDGLDLQVYFDGEIRRFSLEETTLRALQNKIANIFGLANFSLSWRGTFKKNISL